MNVPSSSFKWKEYKQQAYRTIPSVTRGRCVASMAANCTIISTAHPYSSSLFPSPPVHPMQVKLVILYLLSALIAA